MQKLALYALYIVFNEREAVGVCICFSLVSVYIIPQTAGCVNINLLKVFEFTNC
jgi:hypothetical protein